MIIEYKLIDIFVEGVDQKIPLLFIAVPLPHPDERIWMAAVWEDQEEDIVFLGIPKRESGRFYFAHAFTGLIHFERDSELFVLIELVADGWGELGLKLHDRVLHHVQKTSGCKLRRHSDRDVLRPNGQIGGAQ